MGAGMEIEWMGIAIVKGICMAAYLFTGYLFCQVLCCVMQRRGGRLTALAGYVSCVFLAGMIIYPNDIFNVTLDLLWFAAMVFLVFRGSFWQKFAVVAMLYPLVISLNFLIMDIMVQVYIFSGEKAWVNYVGGLADNLVHILFWYGILRIFRKRLGQIGKLFDEKTWMLMGVVCVASFVSITIGIYFCPEESYKMWPGALACIATNIGCLYLAEYFIGSIRHEIERKNLKVEKEYYEELERNQEQIRRLRHDMNHHISVIKALFYSGERKEAESYFSQVESLTSAGSRAFCRNGIVNAVLNAKYQLAQENQIDCFFHIDLSGTLGIDEVSLCSIFANTLDNAIEASLKIDEIEKRRISVKARTSENGYFSYEIKNNKINEIKEKKGRFCTDKEDSKYHGFGIKNVQDIVTRYGGMLDIQHTADFFTITILIRDAV